MHWNLHMRRSLREVLCLNGCYMCSFHLKLRLLGFYLHLLLREVGVMLSRRLCSNIRYMLGMRAYVLFGHCMPPKHLLLLLQK